MTDPFFDCFEHVAASVFVTEPDAQGVLRYTGWNSAAETAFDLPRARVIGRTARDVFPGACGDAMYESQALAFAMGDTAVSEVILPIEGRSKRMRTTWIPKRGSDGTILRLIGTATEASPMLHSYAPEAPIMKPMTEREQFISLAAHDLRTPMRNISILIDMLREDFEDRGDGKLELIDMLEDVAVKSGELIRDVLSHTQETTAHPCEGPFDLGLLCQTLCDVLDPWAAHDIRWPDMVVDGDKTAFQIVLRNLLDNALKHGKKSKLHVDISVHSAAPGMVSVVVQDDGLGFDNPGQAFLETGSFRSDSGYGLLSVRRLLLARGGKISIDEMSGNGGSAITFSLPGSIVGGKPENRVRQAGA
ncbi:PAS domain-containing sensor histidine kinase [uncultured Roseobacter sp.]|uniref:PAS domain-containing sensor histidine kinase n=1 Tax=uncultured Roseobacter sp. TaxID=114847 RepID=UPI0026340968|nr:PAS domain-containing sensor histidine kinase [uncultured Roseobacter sp.]